MKARSSWYLSLWMISQWKDRCDQFFFVLLFIAFICISANRWQLNWLIVLSGNWIYTMTKAIQSDKFMWQYQLKLFAFDVFLLLQVVTHLHTGMTLALSWISNLKTAYIFWKISSSFLIIQESGFTTKQVERSTSWHQMEAHRRDVTSEERY